MICAGVYEPPASITVVALARCLDVPAINCCARATTVPFPVFFAITVSLLSEGRDDPATCRDRDWPSDVGLRCPAALIDCLHWVKPLEEAIPDTLVAK
ncbi:MAG: hypothetical protein ACLP1X_12925 [Polyangiaceae bacterium]